MSQSTDKESATPVTSSAAAPKAFSKRDWEKIIQEFEEEEEKEQTVDDLFKKIYSTGSEEVRKAMNKSFQESGGTVLSTNWTDVANKKVEPKPPSDNDS